jgi:hypothetical protein
MRGVEELLATRGHWRGAGQLGVAGEQLGWAGRRGGGQGRRQQAAQQQGAGQDSDRWGVVHGNSWVTMVGGRAYRSLNRLALARRESPAC